MLNGQVVGIEAHGDVAGASAERIRSAIEQAEVAFWAAIVAAFPEVESGDFDPGATLAWESARNAAVAHWLEFNHPAEVARYAAERDS